MESRRTTYEGGALNDYEYGRKVADLNWMLTNLASSESEWTLLLQ